MAYETRIYVDGNTYQKTNGIWYIENLMGGWDRVIRELWVILESALKEKWEVK